MKLFKTKVGFLIIGLIFLIIILILFLTFRTKPSEDELISKLPPEQTVGLTKRYTEQIDKAKEIENKDYQKATLITNLRTKLPVTTENFSFSYQVNNDHYLVRLLGSDKIQAKNQFLKWLKEQNIEEQDISIVYFENNDFAITKTSLTDQLVGVTYPVNIYFSKPVNRDLLGISISPSISAYYDFNEDLTTLTITPTQYWEYGSEYKISVSKDSIDQTGSKLDKDYEFSFKTYPRSGI